jgi:acyl-CoA synthetase (NDP forming)
LIAAGRRADAAGTKAMSETDSKAWLRDNGIATLPAETAMRREDVRAVAARVGYPAVAKIVSADIVHKTDAGGVVVGLRDAAEAEATWDRIMAAVKAKHPEARLDGLLIERMAGGGGVETLVGVHRDPVFGPMLSFGLGGIHVEVFKDVARRLLPVSRAEALSMVREVRSYALLQGVRGRPAADIEGLADFLVKVSDLVVRHADTIEEMDLNPVWVGPPGGDGPSVVPLDAVLVRATSSSL